MRVTTPTLRHKIMRPILNLDPRTSGCLHCGDKWSWKKPHHFWMEDGLGAFPICEECWRTASDFDIIEASMRLVNKWTSQCRTSEGFKDAIESGEKLMENVKESLKTRKVNLSA